MKSITIEKWTAAIRLEFIVISCDEIFFLCNCFLGLSLVVVDKNCGITSCGVWCLKQKIGFDPGFSTFEPRFPAKRKNIKRDLTRPQGLYTQLYKRQKKSKKSDPATNFMQYKLYWAGEICFIPISINPTCSFICLWQFLSENISNFGESVCFVCSSTPGASRQNHHHYHHCCIDKKTKIRCIGSYGKVAMLHLSSQHSWTNEYRDQIVFHAVFKKNICIGNI